MRVVLVKAGRIGSGRFDRGDRAADELRSGAMAAAPVEKGSVVHVTML